MVYVYFRDYASHFAGINDLYMSIHSHLSRAGVSTSAGKYEVSTEPAEERTLQMPSLREELRNTEIFSVLSDQQIDVLAEHSSYHTFYPEETIVTQGSDDTSLLIIVSGVVQVMKRDDRRLKTEQFLKTMKQSDKAASDFVSDYVEAFVRRIRRFFRV